MLSSDGWLDWAVIKPSGADKVWPDKNGLQGYIPHSAVGTADTVIAQQADNNIPKSVHGVIRYDGSVVQFLPVTTSPWASGSHTANRLFVAFENEGGYDPLNEPLTQAQVNSNIRILEDLAVFKGVYNNYWHRPTDANDLRATLYEHNECTRFGSLGTACPSGRIPWDTILKGLTPLKDGIIRENQYLYLYNNGVSIRRWGSTDPNGPRGREAWNFGDIWWWVRHIDNNGVWHDVAWLSQEEGD